MKDHPRLSKKKPKTSSVTQPNTKKPKKKGKHQKKKNM